MKKVAFVLYTNGLQYDDRARKVVLSLIERNLEVEIFYITPENVNFFSITSYGVPSRQIALRLRNIFPSSSFALLKAIEMYFKFKRYTKDFDVVWINDIEPLFFLLVSRKFLVWDLHEIPSFFQKNIYTKKLFRFVESRCQFIFHANLHRKQFLKDIGLIKMDFKHHVIRNFPDQIFYKSNDIEAKYSEFNTWLGESDFIYLQGLDANSRFPLETIDSVMKFGRMKAIVVGPFDNKLKKIFSEKYGSVFFKTVYFVGKIDQLCLPVYIKKSKFSMIFYTNSCTNTFYCEPNRLFQYLIFDKPVIIGCNPSMKEIVDKYQFGFCLESFGNDVNETVKAMEDILNNYKFYVENIQRNKETIFWANQKFVFDKVANSLI